MRVSKPPQQRRAELVSAARRLFDEKGVDGTRVSDIVSAVGVAQGVFYYYFASKEAMVEEVTAEVAAEVAAEARAILEDGETDLCGKLARFIELCIDIVDQFTADGEPRLQLPDSMEGWKGSPALHSFSVVREALHGLVEQAVQQGELAIEYPAQTVDVLIFGLRALAAERLPGRRLVYTLAEQGLGLPKGGLVRYIT